MTTGQEKLKSRVMEWLQEEGYPLEFYTAAAFSKSNFEVTQGAHVIDKTGKARELDIIAVRSRLTNRSNFKLCRVVECKWSGDKPWVMFKDSSTVLSSIQIANLISSKSGEALTWAMASDESITDLPIFSSSGLSFSGRQALGKSDLFYQAVQGVVTNSISLARQYDEIYPTEHPDKEVTVFVALPTIVVSGELFEASYQADNDEVKLESVKHSRLYWQGNEGRHSGVVIDIITKDYLSDFLNEQDWQIGRLLNEFGSYLNRLQFSFSNKTTEFLQVLDCQRGYIGTPELLERMQIESVKS